MKLPDTFRVACHNIRYNAGRTAVTVSIVAIVSALVMFLLLIGVSFRENLIAVARYRFSLGGAAYTMSGPNTYDFHNNRKVGAITEEEYALYKERAAAHAEVCGYDEANSNLLGLSETGSDSFLLFTGDFRGFEDTTAEDGWWAQPSELYATSCTSVPPGLVFREGRVFSPEDSAGDAIFISREIKRQCENAGRIAEVGDKVLLLDLSRRAEVCSFTIAGFYDGDLPFFIGLDKLFEISRATEGRIYVQNIRMTFIPPAADYDYSATYASMKRFTGEMTAALDQDYELEDMPGADLFAMLFSDVTRRFTNSFVDEMRLVDVISAIVIGVFALLAFFVLLLSVGSVAGNVVISVDKNKKFFGMMKAVGLDKRGLKKLVLCELLLVVTAGVILGIGLLYALFPVANSIVVSIFDYSWGALLPFAVSAAIPVWLPLSAALFFVLLTMLFARGSIRRIAAQDAMVTLSEVS